MATPVLPPIPPPNITALAMGLTAFPGAKPYLAPGLLVTFFQGIELGIVLTQNVRFWHNSKEEQLLVKLVVAFVTTAAM